MNFKSKILTGIITISLAAGAGMFAVSASTETNESQTEFTVTQSDTQTGTGTEQKTFKGKEHSGKEARSSTNVSVISVAASVLGKTEDEIKDAIKADKTGTLLIEAGKVEEFKAAYLTAVREKLDAAVTAGTMTQEEADAKYSAEQEKMAAYDGTAHLCGGTDHANMFTKKDGGKHKTGKPSEDTAAADGI